MLAKTRFAMRSPELKNSHRKSEKAFIRDRILNFPVLILLLLQKGSRSLQLLLNEFTGMMQLSLTVSNGAFTKARKKIVHTIFVELNQIAIVDVMYGDGDYKTYKGFRLLGIDGSKVLLPNTQDVINEFGTIAYSNGDQHKNKQTGEHAYAVAPVMYDVLNHIAIDAVFAKATAYEVDLAVDHLKKSQPNDLFLGDRNYPAYRMLADFTQKNRHFVIRCSKSSFYAARKMLKGEGADSQIVK